MSNNNKNEFANYVVELMQVIGPTYAKPMFGGHGVYLNDLMIALVADDILYFKADKETVDDFTDKDLEAFTFEKKDKTVKLSYYQSPEEALEDSDVMATWANNAFNVALRAHAKKKR